MTGPQQVDLFFSYRVKEGEEALFEQYLAKVLPVTESQEPYVLEYHLFRNADGTVFQHERYADEAAIRDHLRVTADGQADWAAATELLEIRMVGPLSEAFLDEFSVPTSAQFQRFREVAR
jgi:quinol monooxygenase YgiN